MAFPNDAGDISQIIAASYPAVVAKMRTPENQWAESAFLRELERQGGIVREDLGPTIECPVDFQANPDATILTSDTTAVNVAKTEVLSAASFTPAQISVPVQWSKGDDAKNPSPRQKVALVKSLLENGINSHDDLIEQTLFTTSNGLLGLNDLVPDSGQGTPGGIDASTEVFWRNPSDVFVDDSDMEAAMTAIYNACMKGSGSALRPTLIVSDADSHGLFEGTQQGFQRYVDTDELKAGFKVLAFKNARYVFSQYGSSSLYFLNPKSYSVRVSRKYFRDRGEITEQPGYHVMMIMKIYSALQAVTNNKSRLGVLRKAA